MTLLSQNSLAISHELRMHCFQCCKWHTSDVKCTSC